VNAVPSATPLASFEAKWSQAYPEFGLALRFMHGPERDEQSAFACLVFELEHAAFAIREMQPAAIKLQWWAEEFARTANGAARHPLTQTLAARIVTAGIPGAQWQAVVIGALEQRDPEPAADDAALLDHYARLYARLGAIEASLFGTNASAIAGVLTIRRALREAAALPIALQDGKLPLPLDLLAAHRLSRGDLAAASPERDDALRHWFRRLGTEMLGLVKTQDITQRPLGVLRATMAAADAKRAHRAARARKPLATMNSLLGRLSVPVVWSAWRAARRSQA
jgi:phytoene synthase